MKKVIIFLFILLLNLSVNVYALPEVGISCEYKVSFIKDAKEESKQIKINILNDNIKIDKVDNLEIDNKLSANYFLDNNEYKCKKISYSVDKRNDIKLIIDNQDKYNNIVSSISEEEYTEESVSDSNEENTTVTPNPTNTPPPTVTPTPSPSSTPNDIEKLEWNSLGEKTEIATCKEALGDLADKLQDYFNIIKIGVPILLILLGSIDFTSAVMTGDNSKALSKFSKRAIAAVLIYFTPMIVELLFSLPGIPPLEDALCGIK